MPAWYYYDNLSSSKPGSSSVNALSLNCFLSQMIFNSFPSIHGNRSSFRMVFESKLYAAIQTDSFASLISLHMALLHSPREVFSPFRLRLWRSRKLLHNLVRPTKTPQWKAFLTFAGAKKEKKETRLELILLYLSFCSIFLVRSIYLIVCVSVCSIYALSICFLYLSVCSIYFFALSISSVHSKIHHFSKKKTIAWLPKDQLHSPCWKKFSTRRIKRQYLQIFEIRKHANF